MKKGVSLILLTLLLVSSLLIGVVSAASYDDAAQKVRDFTEGLVKIVDPVTSLILGVSYDAATTKDGLAPYFFVKILFFIIVLSIIWLGLSRVEIFYEYPVVLWLVSIAVAILGMKFIVSPEWLSTILLPYGTLAITISAALPFVIYFFIVHIGMKGPRFKTIRSIAWIFFGVIFVFLWFTREELGESAWIYPITALLCFIMIVFDGTFQGFLNRMSLDRLKASSGEQAEEHLLQRMARIDELVVKGLLTPAKANIRKKQIQKQLLRYTK